MDLPRPKTSTQEVLLTLINKGEVSIFDFPYLSGFRTRVSELVRRYKLPIETTLKDGENKFGNHYKYASHKLLQEDKEAAIKIYLEQFKLIIK